MDTNTALLALITGFLLPFITGLLTRAAWKEWVKFLVVIVTAAVVGTVELYITGKLEGLTVETAYSYLGAVYVASGVVFWLLVDSTGLRVWLEAHGLK